MRKKIINYCNNILAEPFYVNRGTLKNLMKEKNHNEKQEYTFVQNSSREFKNQV